MRTVDYISHTTSRQVKCLYMLCTAKDISIPSHKGRKRTQRRKLCTRRLDACKKANQTREKLHQPSIADKALHKRRCCRSIDDVRKVISVDNGKIVANEIIGEAVSLDFARIHVGEWTSFEWIPKDHLLPRINIGSIVNGKISTYHGCNLRCDLCVHHSFS